MRPLLAFVLCVLGSLFTTVAAIIINNNTIETFLASHYDYVVVGGGLSGLVLARRLSEDRNRTVLVVEAGGLHSWASNVSIPGYIGRHHWKAYDWNHRTVPQTSLDGQTRPFDQGRVLGGGSVLNGLCWTRGSAADFDGWEELGNPGWGWEGMLPYFKKSEDYAVDISRTNRDRFNINPNATSHGTRGAIHVSYPRYFYPQSRNVIRGLQHLGIPLLADPNIGIAAGAMILPSSLHPDNQTRADARSGYLDPVVSRSNLHVLIEHTVTRLVLGLPDRIGFQGGKRRVVGVELSSGPTARNITVNSDREVILAAGAIHSPVLMQHSGIGPRDVLESLAIPVQIELEGVGNNFQDHAMIGMKNKYTNSSLFTSLDLKDDVLDTFTEMYLANKTGPLTAPMINTVAFPSLRWLTPDWRNMTTNTSSCEFLPPGTPSTVRAGYVRQRHLLISQLALPTVGVYELMATSHGAFSLAAQKPLSRGTVRPVSNSAFDEPAIDPRYCADPFDCEILALGVRMSKKLLRTDAMKELIPVPDKRFANVNDTKKLIDTLKPLVGTEFHPCGSTSMLPRELGGVVDPNLMVYGTCNLRVVDAGIMPMVPGAHIQAAVYAIAEKAADIIRAANVGPSDCLPGLAPWPAAGPPQRQQS